MSCITKILLVFSIFTISFDVFLAFKIGPATIRFSNIAIFILGLVVIIENLIRGKLTFRFLKYPMFPMLLFIGISFLSVFGSEYIEKSLIYAFYALFNFIFYVWLIIELTKNENDLKFLIKIYIYSFLFVIIFSIFQFFLPFLGFESPLAYAFITDNIPRINAFSYEPTHFVTYLIPGLLLLLFMASRKIKFINPFLLKIGALGSVSVIILSTARSGWIGLLIALLVLFSPQLLKLFFKWKINLSNLKLFFIFIIAFLLVLPIVFSFKSNFLSFVESLPSGASTLYRWQGVLYSLKVFSSNPILGVGIGGLGRYMCNRPSEFNLLKMDMNLDLWYISGSNVATEILASIGLFGFLTWLWLLYRIVKYARIFKNNILIPHEWRIILAGLIWGFIIQIIVLQFNQNFFRNYIWLHMGIILTTCYVLSKKYLKRDKCEEKNL